MLFDASILFGACIVWIQINMTRNIRLCAVIYDAPVWNEIILGNVCLPIACRI